MATKFKFIDSETLLLDSFRLGKKIYESGIIPTHAISLWRGGTPVGLGVGEYFRLKGHFINHTTVATASYTGINSQSDVIIKGLEHLIKVVAKEDTLLIIDDIYDSGKTIYTIIDTIKRLARANSPDNIFVACIHKKLKKRENEISVISLYELEDEIWINYPHEISDLIIEKDDSLLKKRSEEIYNILHTAYFQEEEIKTGKKYTYISANSLLLDSLKLGVNIFQQGYIPDFLIALWPGGISAGLPIHEAFKYKIKMSGKDIKIPDHISINTSLSHFSYKTNIIGIKYLEDNINWNDNILIVNTIFNTGRLVNHTIDKLKEILRRNIDINKIKIATVYYNPINDATWVTNPTFIKPHFYLKKIDSDVIFPHQIHRLFKPEEELKLINPELRDIIYS